MTVLRVDLRRTAVEEAERAERAEGAEEFGPFGPDEGTEREPGEIVDDAVNQAQACDSPRFLIVDHARDLVEHQPLYEKLLGYGSVPTICLAVGAPGMNGADGVNGVNGGVNGPAGEGSSPSGSPSGAPRAQLARPLSLKPPSAGVLWAPDPEYGMGPGGAEAGEADHERQRQTVRPLAQLLEEPHVFDAVRHALGEIREGVAVVAPRVLEHDLTESARIRVWRQALEGLCGREVHVALPPSGYGEDRLPHELAPLVGEEVPKALGDRVWCMPRGEADEGRRDCEAALRQAQDVYQQVRSPFAWLRKETSRRAGLPDRLAELADALTAYRKTAEECLREGDGVRLSPEQRSRLARRGIDLPDIPEASREHVVPGLRRYTEALIDRPLPLRSVAARLAALSDHSAPKGSAARLGQLNEACPLDYPAMLRRPAMFDVVAPGFWANALPGFVMAFLAAVGWVAWGGWIFAAGWLLGLAATGLALLMQIRRPNCTADGRVDGGGQSNAGVHIVTGVLGAAGGVAAGQKLMLPVWAGATTMCLAVALLILHAMWQWTSAVDEWWAQMRPEDAAPMWADIEKVLSEAAVHDWMLAEARLHCADGARAVSVLLRNFATELAEHEADSPAQAGSSGDQSPGDEDLFAAAPRAADSPDPAGEPRPEPSAESMADADPDGDWEPWDWDTWDDDPQPAPAAGESAPGTGAGESADAPGPAPAPPPAPDVPADVPAEPPRPFELRWLTRESGDAGRALVDTLIRDLADGVIGVVAGCWGVLEADPNAVGRFRVAGRVAELVDEERACLARDGAAAPPPYSRPRAEVTRPGTAELFGIATDRIARILADGEAKRPQPLCSPSRTRMLSRDPGAARTVRFAPESARRGAARDALGDSGWDTASDDVVWTMTGRFAGVLRLVPLSGGAVRTVRSYGSDGEREQ